MRLLPIKDPERSWRTIKAQWKKDAEGVGEEFATFAGIAAFDALASREATIQASIASPRANGFMRSARSGGC